MRWVLPLVVLVGACTRSTPMGRDDIAFSGCDRVLVDRGCVLGKERVLKVWVRETPGAKVVVSVDGQVVGTVGQPVEDGSRYDVTVPEGAARVSLLRSDARGRATFSQRLVEGQHFARVEAAKAERRAGRAAEAVASLEGALDDMDAAERASARSVLGRLLLALGRVDEALKSLEAAAPLHRETGCVSCAVEDNEVRLYALMAVKRDQASGRALLSHLESAPSDDPSATMTVQYWRGFWDSETGDLRSAARALENSRRAAGRVDRVTRRRAAEQMIAVVTQALGHHREAATQIEALIATLPEDADPCEGATLHNNAGWLRLLAADAQPDVKVAGEAEQHLAQALSLYQTQCLRPPEVANTLVNLALAAVLRQDWTAARKQLAALAAAAPVLGPRLKLWQLDIVARLDLGTGRPDQALRLYAQLDALGDASEAIDARFRAALGSARALKAQNRIDNALSAFAQAEDYLDEAARRVALGDGRDAFFSLHARAVEEHVATLLEHRRVAEAAAVARQARRRLVASLAQVDALSALPAAERERWNSAVSRYRALREQLERETAQEWQLSGEALRHARLERARLSTELREIIDAATAASAKGDRQPLPAPEPGELVLLVTPLLNDWAVFSITSEGAQVAHLGSPRLDDAERVLSLASASIERAQRIRLVTAGEAEALDFHAAAWRGRPLVAHAPVVYGYDLPSAPSVNRPKKAAILADPSGNLAAARAESAEVRRLLDGRGFEVTTLSGHKVTAADIHRALADSQILHYAGHAEADPRDRLGLGLRLPSGTFLSVADILTLERAPPLVVLGACDTAVPSGGRVQGLSVTQAFATKGAGAVVAATRPVDDAETLALMRAFYAHLVDIAPTSVANALRLAQLEQAARGAAGWSSYRVFVP